MADINPIITTPVDIHAVSEVLKRSQTDFQQVSSRDTFDLAALCTHANINMWAKYKPFRSNIMFFKQDGDSTKSDRDEEMRRQNHGIQPPDMRSSTNIASCINDVWTYLRPRGKDYNEPYRLADFINYSHQDNAFAVAKTSVTVNRYFDYSGIITLTEQRGIISVYALQVSDFAIFDTLSNLAVLVTPASGGSVYVRVTQGIQELVQVTTAEINALPFSFGERLTFAFLATNHATTSFTAAPGNAQWLIMPNDGVNKTYGELVLTSDFHHNKTCNGFALDPTSPPLVTFTGQIPIDGGEKYYYYPKSDYRYSGYLDLTLTNTAEAVTLKRSLFFVRAYNNLVTGSKDTPLMRIPKMYVGGVETEEVDVAESASVTIRFMLPDYIFITTTSGGTGTVEVSNRLMSCFIKFYYNNITDTIIFSQDIRIKDYENSQTGGGGSSGGDAPTPSVAVDLQDQWQPSSVAISGYTIYESFSNYNVGSGIATIKLTIKNKPDFKLYINSYAESSYDYTIAWDLDTQPAASPAYNTAGVKAHTRGTQKDPAAGIANFTEVDYANDGGTHTIYITYRKDGSVNTNNDRGYIAIKNS